MPRQAYIINATIQFENPLQAPQWGAPIFLTSVSLITNETGQALYQPSHMQQPATPEDITDELLDALNNRFASVGLTVQRVTNV